MFEQREEGGASMAESRRVTLEKCGGGSKITWLNRVATESSERGGKTSSNVAADCANFFYKFKNSCDVYQFYMIVSSIIVSSTIKIL